MALAAGRAEAPVRVQGVTDSTVVAPGDILRVGVRLDIQPGWHVYWKNSGDAGIPTQVRFAYDPGLEPGAWVWPGPRRFEDPGGITTYGYTGRVLIWQTARVRPSTPAGRRLTVRGQVRWLACREVCIPGREDLTLTVAVGPETVRSVHASVFRSFEPQVPVRPEALRAWRFRVERPSAGLWVFEVQVPTDERVAGLEWFPEDPHLRVTGQTWEGGSAMRLRVRTEVLGDGPETERGVLRVQTPRRVFYVQFP